MNEFIMNVDRLGRLSYAPEQKAAIIEDYLATLVSKIASGKALLER